MLIFLIVAGVEVDQVDRVLDIATRNEPGNGPSYYLCNLCRRSRIISMQMSYQGVLAVEEESAKQDHCSICMFGRTNITMLTRCNLAVVVPVPD